MSGAGHLLRAAVVLDADGARFVAVGHSRPALLRQLADYVAANLTRLWPDDASRVRRLLARGAAGAALRHYLAAVGRRWDAEWVELHPVAPSADRGRVATARGARRPAAPSAPRAARRGAG